MKYITQLQGTAEPDAGDCDEGQNATCTCKNYNIAGNRSGVDFAYSWYIVLATMERHLQAIA